MALESLCNFRPMDAFREKRQNDIGIDEQFSEQDFKHQTIISLPPFAHPVETLQAIKEKDEYGRPLKMEFNKGTTTCSFKYQGGVIVCVDSRATGGQYIGSGNVRKVIEINDYMLGTMAGGAADCMYWLRVLSQRCRLYELRNKERMSVAAASKLFANMLYNYKGSGLSVGSMIMGYDKSGPGLYYVDDSGNRLSGTLFSAGSGSPYALGVLDSGYRWDLTDNEAYDLAQKAITAATHFDSYSGSIVRLYHLNQDGWKIIAETDCLELFNKYRLEKGMPIA